MRELALTMRRWAAADRPGVIVRAAEESGIGARRPDAAYAVNADGERAGGLYGGAADTRIDEAARAVLAGGAARLLPVELSEADAVRCGLGCGGSARLLVQPLAAVPPAWWEAICEPRGAALVTPLDPPGTSLVVTADAVHGSLGEATEEAVRYARRRLAKARGAREIVDIAGAPHLVEISSAAPSVTVVGTGVLATALERQAALLGWDCAVTETPKRTVERFAANTCLVVLSHDPEVYTPVLAAALRAGLPYVGALGARHTVAARAERLREQGLPDDAITAIHSPVGLDLGARGPEETALAICAEILTALSGRSATPLRDSTAAINA